MWKRLSWLRFLGKKKPLSRKPKKRSIHMNNKTRSVVQTSEEHCVQKNQQKRNLKTSGPNSEDGKAEASVDSVYQFTLKQKRKDIGITDENVVTKRKKSITVDSADRTAQLPESVIHHILSFLTCRKDAARTSTFSKRWRRVWISYTGLDFDEHKFQKQLQRSKIEGDEKKMFIDFVNQSIDSFQKSDVHKLALHITSCDSELASQIDRWMNFAVQNHFNDLDLRFPLEGCYAFPRALLASKTITTLRLRGCQWEGEGVALSNLRKLCLRELHNISEKEVKSLVVSCPLIEDLRFIKCSGLQNLRVSSLKLDRVEVHQCDGLRRIGLEAPNLSTFWYSGNKSMGCNLKLDACKSLKGLTLEDPRMRDTLFQKYLSNFPLLEKLNLTRCNLLNSIEISSQRLERLVLRECKKLIQAGFDTPKLVSFEYKGNDMPFSALNPFCLEEAKISIHRTIHLDDLGNDGFIQMKEFLQKFDYSKGLKLVLRHKENVIIHEDWREIMLPRERDLHIEIFRSSISHEELVDSVLRMWHPRFLIVLSCPGGKFPSLISDMLWESKQPEHPICCKYPSNRCWRCCLGGGQELNMQDGFSWLSTFLSHSQLQKTRSFKLFWNSK